MGDDDRRVLERLRAAVPRWLASVDRLTPSEMLGALLAETAYALRDARRAATRRRARTSRSCAGWSGAFPEPRLRDARARRRPSRAAGGRRRVERRDRRARLRQPDDRARGEGSRVPDRVRRQLRARHRRRPRAHPRERPAPAGEASVAIADYQSEADEDAQARDREETKRLLYVALTRARDRLYLSTTVQDGVCRMGRGSLGEVLPASFRTCSGRRRGQWRDRPKVDRPGPVPVGMPSIGSPSSSSADRLRRPSAARGPRPLRGLPPPARRNGRAWCCLAAVIQAIQCGPRASA